MLLRVFDSASSRASVGAALSRHAVVVAWLLRREASRSSGLLSAYAGSRLVLLVAVAGGYLGARPLQQGWIWTATALALLAVLTEPTIRVLLSKTEQVAVNLPGVRPVPTAAVPARSSGRRLAGPVVVGGLLAARAAHRPRRTSSRCWSTAPPR